MVAPTKKIVQVKRRKIHNLEFRSTQNQQRKVLKRTFFSFERNRSENEEQNEWPDGITQRVQKMQVRQ